MILFREVQLIQLSFLFRDFSLIPSIPPSLPPIDLYRLTNQPTHQPTYQSIDQSIDQSINPSIYPSIYLCIYIHLYTYIHSIFHSWFSCWQKEEKEKHVVAWKTWFYSFERQKHKTENDISCWKTQHNTIWTPVKFPSIF